MELLLASINEFSTNLIIIQFTICLGIFEVELQSNLHFDHFRCSQMIEAESKSNHNTNQPLNSTMLACSVTVHHHITCHKKDRPLQEISDTVSNVYGLVLPQY